MFLLRVEFVQMLVFSALSKMICIQFEFGVYSHLPIFSVSSFLVLTLLAVTISVSLMLSCIKFEVMLD